MLPMHFPCRLTLDLNSWCISVEEEVGDIYLPIVSSLSLELDRHTLAFPIMPAIASFSPIVPALKAPPIQAPSAAPSPAIAVPFAPRGGRSYRTPPVNLLIHPCIGLFSCISTILGAWESLPALDNGSGMCLAWSMCVSYSINCCKHRYHRAHRHLSGPKLQCALAFSCRWCQDHTDPPPAT